MPSNHLILCCPLLPSIFPSIRVFSSEWVLCIKWPKYWSFSFSISPSNEYSGLISFRMDWLDLLLVQGTLQESSPTPQFKSVNSSALSLLQLSHPYMTTGKTTALTGLAVWPWGNHVTSNEPVSSSVKLGGGRAIILKQNCCEDYICIFVSSLGFSGQQMWVECRLSVSIGLDLGLQSWVKLMWVEHKVRRM